MSQLLSAMAELFLIASLGFWLGKRKLITEGTIGELSHFLMKYILPLTILRSFLKPYDPEEALNIATVSLVMAINMGLALFFLRLFLKKYPLEQYAMAFGNLGFLGIPLVSSLFGPDAVFYVAPLIAVNHLFLWGYGRGILIPNHHFHIREVFCNPSFVCFMIGLAFYLIPLPKPALLKDCLSRLTALNSPLAMIVLGAILSQKPLLQLFQGGRVWMAVFGRLFLMPLFVCLLLYLLPFPRPEVKVILAVALSMPTATHLTLLARSVGADAYRATQLTVLSTLLCPLSLPLVYTLVRWIF